MEIPDPQLALELKRYQAGSNVHTVNKARCYYKSIRSPKRRAKLDTMIRVALVNHDWIPLRVYMRRWF